MHVPHLLHETEFLGWVSPYRYIRPVTGASFCTVAEVLFIELEPLVEQLVTTTSIIKTTME